MITPPPVLTPTAENTPVSCSAGISCRVRVVGGGDEPAPDSSLPLHCPVSSGSSGRSCVLEHLFATAAVGTMRPNQLGAGAMLTGRPPPRDSGHGYTAVQIADSSIRSLPLASVSGSQ